MPVGAKGVAIHATTHQQGGTDVVDLEDLLQELTFNGTEITIIAAVDNTAPINVASVAGIKALYVEWFLFFITDNDDVTNQLVGEIHDPSHNVLEDFDIDFSAVLFNDRIVQHIRARDATPETGNYHLDITTKAGAGTIVKQRRAIGVRAAP